MFYRWPPYPAAEPESNLGGQHGSGFYLGHGRRTADQGPPLPRF